MERRDDTGPLPTIGDAKALRAPGVTVFCTRPYCPNSSRITWDVLDLPDDVIILDIPKRRSFRWGIIRLTYQIRNVDAGGKKHHP